MDLPRQGNGHSIRMEPVAIYKLIILYMLDRAGGELAMPRTSSFLIENGYATNFESLIRTYEEIEQNGFVAERKRGDKTFLEITDSGEETLGFFSDQLSDSIKKQVRGYLSDIGRKIANEELITGEYYRSTYGDYTVHLTVKEKAQTSAKSGLTQPIVAIDLAVPDEETAKKAAENWEDRSSEIYQKLLDILLKEQ